MIVQTIGQMTKLCFLFRPVIDARGSRTTMKLRFLTEQVNHYECVLVGNNDINSKTDEEILHNIKMFKNALRKDVNFKICGFLPRRDHPMQLYHSENTWENLVKRLNNKLRKLFPKGYASPACFKLEDFLLEDGAHLKDLGQKHMSQFVLKMFRIFNNFA